MSVIKSDLSHLWTANEAAPQISPGDSLKITHIDTTRKPAFIDQIKLLNSTETESAEGSLLYDHTKVDPTISFNNIESQTMIRKSVRDEVNNYDLRNTKNSDVTLSPDQELKSRNVTQSPTQTQLLTRSTDLHPVKLKPKGSLLAPILSLPHSPAVISHRLANAESAAADSET